MSFGFSISDFVTVGKTIRDISASLKDAKSEFQELLRELESLDRTLRRLDELRPQDGSPGKELDSIKCAALTCRWPLEAFLRKIRKYERDLGVGPDRAVSSLRSAGEGVASRSRFRGLMKRGDWAWNRKDEMTKLQSYLSIHLANINMLLMIHGLERWDLVAKENQQGVQEAFDVANGVILSMESNVKAQSTLVRSNNSILRRLVRMIGGEMKLSIRALAETIARVSVCTQQIYTVVLDIHSFMKGRGIDTRWTFFQQPVRVEDALGRIFPVPSEYSVEQLQLIIRDRFKEGPGHEDVQAGNYELFNTKNSSQTLESLSLDRLLSSMSLTMAILISQMDAIDEICPMPQCGSEQTAPAIGGGRTCCECNVWFSQSSKKRIRIEDLSDIVAEDSPLIEANALAKSSRPWDPSLEVLKNVRCGVDDDLLQQEALHTIRVKGGILFGRISPTGQNTYPTAVRPIQFNQL